MTVLTPDGRRARILADLRKAGEPRVGEKEVRESLTGNPVIDAEILGLEVPAPMSDEFKDQADAIFMQAGKGTGEEFEKSLDKNSGSIALPSGKGLSIQDVRDGGASSLVKGISTERIKEGLSSSLQDGDFATASEILSLMRKDLTPEALLADQIKNLKRQRQGQSERFDLTRSGAFSGEKKSLAQTVSDLDKASFTKMRGRKADTRAEKQARIRDKQFDLSMNRFLLDFKKARKQAQMVKENLETLRKKNKSMGTADKIRAERVLKLLQKFIGFEDTPPEITNQANILIREILDLKN